MLTPVLAVCLAVFFQQIEAVTPNKHRLPPDPKIWVSNVTLIGNTAPLYSLSHSPDGKIIATANGEKIARLWNAVSGKELSRLEGHTDSILRIIFSPDGKLLATSGRDKSVRVWDTATCKEIAWLPKEMSGIGEVVFSPDGKRLATCSKGDRARLWDVATGKELSRVEYHISSTSNVLFSPNNKGLLTDGNNAIQIWNSQTGKLLFELEGRLGEEFLMATFRPHDGRLITCHSDGSVRLWDSQTGKYQGNFLPGVEYSFLKLVFSSDGKLVAGLNTEDAIQLWNVESCTCLGAIKLRTGHRPLFGFRDDGKLYIAQKNQDKTTSIWYLSRD